jgi:release factor glutamine methyltransferase
MSMSQDSEWLLKEKYHGEKSDAFFADVKRLALGEPLAYIIGHVPFLNTTIYLDSHPLIPRTETEFWVEKAIVEIKQSLIPVPRVLDLCAGSGCIGVAVARAIPHAIVDFAEIDADHISTIKKNVERNDIPSHRVNIVHSSLFTKLPERYDFILSNPPYIDENLNRVDSSVKHFEPHIALFGGAEGLEVISALIKDSRDHLTSAGQLWLEHEPEQADTIADLGNQYLFTVNSHRDQFGTERYSTLVVQ